MRTIKSPFHLAYDVIHLLPRGIFGNNMQKLFAMPFEEDFY